MALLVPVATPVLYVVVVALLVPVARRVLYAVVVLCEVKLFVANVVV